MKTFITFLLCLCVAAVAVAQVSVTGRVIEKESGKGLAGASVIFRNAEGKIKKYASTGSDGSFAISVPSADGCTVEVSMISFAKKKVSLTGAKFPLTVALEPAAFELKEVAVKAQSIREQGDTITYSVGSFAQAQDRTIGDVLKRMPGIDVEKSGKIKYQGEDINKFYIEGSDLLGGKYGIATNGISHDDVGAVEVMENHQPMQVLAGISYSDKAAINLKLKNKAKATWAFNGHAGAGYSCQPEGVAWDGNLFAMAVMGSFQNISTLKTNNTGTNLTDQMTDFFAGMRETDLSPYVTVSLPSVPSLKEKRTLFNRSALFSSNSLWKLKNGEFKAQLDYSFNRVTSDAANVTTYFLPDGDRTVTENRSGVDRSHTLSGKFIYELNRRTTFINNTLNAKVDWDKMRLSMDGSIPNTQSVELPDYYVGNNFKMIKRFTGTPDEKGRSKNHLVTFESKNEWESLPQTLVVSLSDDGRLRQHVGNHAFFTDESVAYGFSFRGITVSLKGGLKGYVRSLDTSLPDMPEEIPGETQNVLNTNYLTLYASPKFEYWISRVNVSLSAPVSFANYDFDKAIANRSEVFFSPSLSLSWKPNNRFSMSLRGGSGRSPMALNLIQPGYIMKDYRSFQKGVDDFYTSTSQRLSANLTFKNTRKGIFADARVAQSWGRNPYTLAQQLYGDYIVYSYSPVKSDRKLFMATASLGKTLDFMRGSANLSSSFNRSEHNLLSENAPVSSVGTAWDIRARVNGQPLRWLSVDYAFDYSENRLEMNSIGASWLGKMTNSLLLNVIPHPKWEWHLIGEHYRNEISADRFKDVVLLDTKLLFKLNRRIELCASLSNILNRRTYNYTTYNQLSSFESQRYLRGREFLFTVFLKK